MKSDKLFYVCCKTECKRRRIDTGKIVTYLTKNNWKPAKDYRFADIIIIYTCGGFKSTEERSLLTIKKMFSEKKEGATIIVTGCLVKINYNAIKNLGDFKILTHDELNELDNIINALVSYNSVPDVNIVTLVNDLVPGPINGNSKITFALNSRFFWQTIHSIKKSAFGLKKIYELKIAHGCLGECTYCSIRFSTGKLRSKPLDEIIQEFDNGLSMGYKRFRIIAEDTGSYGQDFSLSIFDLFTRIFSKEEKFSVIILDFNPQWLIKYYDQLFPLFLKNRKRIEILKMPIQSGSNRILKQMNRPYLIEDVKKVILDLKHKIPSLKIHTHVLTGFPGETEDDFNKTREFLELIDFFEVSLYGFEIRPGTIAAELDDKISKNIIMKRIKKLKKFQ